MKKLVSFLDSLSFSPVAVVMSVILIAITRLFLESFSSPEVTGFFAPIVGVISYASLYGMLMTLFTLLLSAITRKPMMWSLRVIALVFPLVMLTPIIDLLFSGGAGFCIGYVQQGGKTLFNQFFTFLFAHGQSCGITPGLRIQIVAASLGLGGIAWAVTRSWWKSLLAVIGTYSIAFVGGTLPLIVSGNFLDASLRSLLFTIHYPSEAASFTVYPSTITTTLLARIQLIVALAGTAAIWFYASRQTWKAWWMGSWKKIPIAAIHFVLLTFGLTVGYSVAEPTLTWPDWIGIAILLLALFMACWNLGVANDVEDIPIDRISNPDRPLIRYGMKVEQARVIQHISGIFAAALAFTVNYNAAFCIAAFIGFYALHSSGLRLKRFWPTASILIALAGCAAFAAGYFTLSADQIVGNMPLSVIVMIATMLLPYTFLKDIPDIEGDRHENIKTFAATYGLAAAAFITIGLCVAWLVLFWNVIPWFFSLGVILSLLVTCLWKRSWVRNKTWLLGLPILLWSAFLILHIILVF